MAAHPTPLIAGNWKMNGLRASLGEIETLAQQFGGGASGPDILVCPPVTLIAEAVRMTEGTRIRIGGQDCHFSEAGAHTGDVSAAMLKDVGAVAVIIGHSERRADHGETDTRVSAKTIAAQAAGLTTIVCVGETLGERDDGRAIDVVGGQIGCSLPADCDPAQLVVAYEPVWAIGTGRTPSEDDVAQIHGAIRSQLEDRFGEAGRSIRILYGGSVKPANAAALLAVDHVNGALVGGASLKAADFGQIISAAPVS